MQYTKGALDPTEGHFRRFKESMRHACQLPQGVKPDPSEDESKEWYFRTFFKKHRSAFLSTGKELKDSTMEAITEFMCHQQEKNLNDGTTGRLSKNRTDLSNNHRNRQANDKYGHDHDQCDKKP